MHQNAPFRRKNAKIFLGRGHSPLPRPHPTGEGDTPDLAPVGADGGKVWGTRPPRPHLTPPLTSNPEYAPVSGGGTTNLGGGTAILGGGTAILGGGTPDTGGGTPFQPIPAEFNHCIGAS